MEEIEERENRGMIQIQMRQLRRAKRVKEYGSERQVHQAAAQRRPVDHFTSLNAPSGETEKGEGEGRREHRDTNNGREGQGGVYDMEGEKMEGGGRKGPEKIGLHRRRSPVSHPSRCCFTAMGTLPWMWEKSGYGRKRSRLCGCCRRSSLCNSTSLLHFPTHTHTHTQTHTHTHTTHSVSGSSQRPAVRLLRGVMSDINSRRVSSFSPTIQHS